MSLSDLASLGSFVSGIAVLVSLVYLALQTRALTRNQRASIHWGRLQERTQWIRFVTQPDFIDTYLRGNAADQTMDDAQCTRYYHVIGSELREFEELFYQHRDGLIDEKRQESNLNRLRLRCAVPGFRVTWSVQREFYNEDFAQ